MFFSPIKIDMETLAQAIEDGAIEEALYPLTTGLDRLAAVQSAFDIVINAAREQFGL